jgi:hypothetical protein
VAVPRDARRREAVSEGLASSVVAVEHDPAGRRAQLGQPMLDRAVRLHRPVPVEVVLADVRVQRDVGAAADRRQLELAQLEDGPVLWSQLPGTLDERGPDVAAQNARHAGSGQHGRHQRRGRGFALGAGHAEDARARQAKEELDLAHQLGTAHLGRGQRIAQPRIRGAEAGRDGRAGDEQIRVLEQRDRGCLVDAQCQAHRSCAERRNGLHQLGRRATIICNHDGAGVGEEAAGGDPGSRQAEHDRATAAKIVRASDRCSGCGHHRSTRGRSRRPGKR